MERPAKSNDLEYYFATISKRIWMCQLHKNVYMPTQRVS